jgi:hypothetical protein
MGLMIFNVAGYRFTLRWMQQAQNISFEKQLDAAEYDESSLIEIAVPLSLPYYNNWGEWERYDGEIQVGGQTWKYVKRKIENGKLVVKCLPNPQQQIIQKNVSSAFAQLNGLSTSDPTSKSIKKVIKVSQFEYEELAMTNLQESVIVLIEKPTSIQFHCPLQATSSSPWQPPEFIS